jgi:hypothetical protein
MLFEAKNLEDALDLRFGKEMRADPGLVDR